MRILYTGRDIADPEFVSRKAVIAFVSFITLVSFLALFAILTFQISEEMSHIRLSGIIYQLILNGIDPYLISREPIFSGISLRSLLTLRASRHRHFQGIAGDEGCQT